MEAMSGYDRAVVVDAAVTGGVPGTVRCLGPEELPTQRTAIAHGIDLTSGARTPWARLSPPSATGVGHVWSLLITPDGQGYAYTHGFFLEDLFLVDGL